MQDVAVPRPYPELDALAASLFRAIVVSDGDLSPQAKRLAMNIVAALGLLRIHTPRSIGRAKELIVRDIDRLTAMLEGK